MIHRAADGLLSIGKDEIFHIQGEIIPCGLIKYLLIDRNIFAFAFH